MEPNEQNKQTHREQTDSCQRRGTLGGLGEKGDIKQKSEKQNNRGEPFQAWEMWLSPHSEKPVGSKAGGQDPRPWIGSPVGNQACIVPRLL